MTVPNESLAETGQYWVHGTGWSSAGFGRLTRRPWVVSAGWLPNLATQLGNG
jgi:hypothetical protein